MKTKLFVLALAILVAFSVAQAGQITTHEIYFFEDSNEYRMGNGVVGLIAYKNKGLEQNRPTYYKNLLFEDVKANEEIYLEKEVDGGWITVKFNHYSVSMDEEAHTITKHYWNNLDNSLDITYKLADYGSPIKLSFVLWGLNGNYRIQWTVSEINTKEMIEDGYEKIYFDVQEGVEPQKDNGTIIPMSNIPITIDPPTPFPENYELMIDYEDLIEAVGNEKVSVTTEYNEDGSVGATTFILGDFSMQFWEVLELDPAITSGHTTTQLASSIIKNNGLYFVTVMGDFESGTDDGAYILINSNFSNSSNWTKSTAIGGETAPRNNFVFADNNTNLHFIMSDSSGRLQEKNSSSNGTTWATKQQVIASTDVNLFNYFGNPKSQLMTNGITIFPSVQSSNYPIYNTYNSTSDTFSVSSTIASVSANHGISSFFNNITNRSYIIWTQAGNNTTLASGINFAVPSSPIGINTSLAIPRNPQIHKYNQTLYLFFYTSDTDQIHYLTCPATNNCTTDSEWGSGNKTTIPNQYNFTLLYNNIIAIDNEGLFVFPSTNSLTEKPYHIFNNNTWFKLNDLGLTYNWSNAFDYLNLAQESGKILMTYSDITNTTVEIYANEYTIPDIVVNIQDSTSNLSVLTNQTLNVYCGEILKKTTTTTTGSIAIYPIDYSGCATNSTTIQLTQNDYQEVNLTVTRDSSLKGYTLFTEPIGWNITLDKYGCTNTTLNNWNLFATNGTNNYSFINQNTSRIFTVVDINLTNSINFTFWENKTDNLFDTTTYSTFTDPAYILTKSYDVYSLIPNNTNLSLRSSSGDTAFTKLGFRYLDGTTANATEQSQYGTSWLQATYINPNTTKIVKSIDLYQYSVGGSSYVTNVSINYEESIYKNKTISTTRPIDSLTQITEIMDKQIYVSANDRRYSTPISNFFMILTNGTTNKTLQASGLYLDTNLTNLTIGSTNFSFQITGYNNSYKNATIDCNFSSFTQDMEKAGLQVQTFNEDTLANMTYNITIANSTTSTSFLNQINGVFWNYTQIPNGAITITVSADGFEQRSYTGTMNSNTFINQTAYLLSNSEGLIRSFLIVNTNYQVISGAYIRVEKLIGSSYVLISDGYTDNSGVKTFLLNPSDEYRIEATSGGATSGYKYIQPTQPQYTIQIPITTTAVEGYSGLFTQVSYTIYPNSLWIQVSNSSIFSFSVTAWVNDLGSYSMVLKDQNNTILYNNTTISTIGGTMNTSIDTTNLSRVIGLYTINRTGFEPFTITRYYTMYDFNTTNSGLLGVFTTMQNADDISTGAKSIIILVVTVALMGTIVGYVGGFGAGVIGLSLITISTLFGWFDYRITVLLWSLLIGLTILTRGI